MGEHDANAVHQADGVDAVRRLSDGAEVRVRGRGKQDRKSPQFTLVPFREITLSTAADYVVKGLIPRQGLVVVYGPPKCGKSFWTFDLVMHPAIGVSYRGRRVTQGDVVYLSLEGRAGFNKLVEAWKKRNGVYDAAFHLITDRTNLIADHAAVIDSIEGQLGDKPPIVVVIDTLNRSLVGSESKDVDMAAYLAAADAIAARFGCVVIVVHHSGVEKGRPRGHTSLTAAADAQLAVMRDSIGNVVVTLEYVKDGAEGEVLVSRSTKRRSAATTTVIASRPA